MGGRQVEEGQCGGAPVVIAGRGSGGGRGGVGRCLVARRGGPPAPAGTCKP